MPIRTERSLAELFGNGIAGAYEALTFTPEDTEIIVMGPVTIDAVKKLLQMRPGIFSEKDKGGRGLIHLLAEFGELPQDQDFYAYLKQVAGENILEQKIVDNHLGHRPVFSAMVGQHAMNALRLAEAGADIHTPDNGGYGLAFWAAGHSAKTALGYMAEKYSLDIISPNTKTGETPVGMLCAKLHSCETFKKARVKGEVLGVFKEACQRSLGEKEGYAHFKKAVLEQLPAMKIWHAIPLSYLKVDDIIEIILKSDLPLDKDGANVATNVALLLKLDVVREHPRNIRLFDRTILKEKAADGKRADAISFFPARGINRRISEGNIDKKESELICQAIDDLLRRPDEEVTKSLKEKLRDNKEVLEAAFPEEGVGR